MKTEKIDRAKILYLDIEATNLDASMGFILSIGYRWDHWPKGKTRILRIDETPHYKKNRTNDAGLLKEFEPIFNEADLVVHHFGDFYDIPYIQTRRAIHGLKKLADVKTVDTWRIARKKMKFHSNRLDTIARVLGCPYEKTQVDGRIWVEAMAGIPSALNYIVKHNKLDVLVLEWVYKKIASMWPSHPRVFWAFGTCKVCGGKNISNGPRANQKHRYIRLRCVSCGHNDKGPKYEG